MPADGKARKDEQLDAERRRHDAGGVRKAHRLSHRARDRVRAGNGDGQNRSRSRAPHHVLPRGRLGDRALGTQRTGCHHEPAAVRAGRGLEDQLRLQLGLRRRQQHRLLPLAAGTRSWRGDSLRNSRSSEPANTTTRASNRSCTPRTCCRSRSTPTRSTPIPRVVEQQAGTGLLGRHEQVRAGARSTACS